MSLHSYSRCWLHLVWATLDRQLLLGENAAVPLSAWFYEYATAKGIYLKINFVNPDHVHALIDLATNLSIEEAVHLLDEEETVGNSFPRPAHSSHLAEGRC